MKFQISKKIAKNLYKKLFKTLLRINKYFSELRRQGNDTKEEDMDAQVDDIAE